jgi:hypothetical protein
MCKLKAITSFETGGWEQALDPNRTAIQPTKVDQPMSYSRAIDKAQHLN